MLHAACHRSKKTPPNGRASTDDFRERYREKLSKARRATAADILTESGQWSVANNNPFKKMKNTE